jgi:agmatinase
MTKSEAPSDRPLIVSQRTFIESSDANHVVLFERECSQRIRISRPLYSLLMKFEQPARLAEVCAAENVPTSAERALKRLITKRFLVDAETLFEARRKPLTRNPYTLFNCPRCSGTGCESDVAVIGIPYDLGSQVAPGARNGPMRLRLRSNEYDYRVNFRTGSPMGWFDVDAQERILEGTRVCDRGDMWFAYGEAPELIGERLESLCREGHGHALPLFVGGDHSMTYFIVKALQTDQPIVVIWLDAHSDMGHFIPPASHNHFSVARRVFGLPNVTKMIHAGYRGYAMKDEINTGDSRRTVLTAKTLRQHGAEAILQHVPEDAACYLSIDLDVLDPGHAPAVSSPSPGGLAPEELEAILSQLGQAREFKGIDVMEFNPEMEGADRTGTVAARLLIATLGGVKAYSRPDGAAQHTIEDLEHEAVLSN